MYEELKDNNFEIIAVAEDTGGEAAAGEWYDRAEATYTTLIDTTHKISSLYNLVNVPSAVWVDEDGQIVRINEGTYAQVHTLGTFEFGTDEYAPAVRDWAIRGADSPYVWTADEVAAKIRPRTADEARAESTFKLGVYFFEQGDEPLARIYWERAEALHAEQEGKQIGKERHQHQDHGHHRRRQIGRDIGQQRNWSGNREPAPNEIGTQMQPV